MTVGTTSEVLESFVAEQGIGANRPHGVTRTASAPVPGGCRVSIEGPNLYSYRTVQAVRLSGERVAVWPGSGLTVTTSKLLSHLRGALYHAGYRPTAERYDVTWTVPGRWGGFGPAWHATGYEVTPFEVWEDSPEARVAYDQRMADDAEQRAAKAAAKAARRAETIGMGL